MTPEEWQQTQDCRSIVEAAIVAVDPVTAIGAAIPPVVEDNDDSAGVVWHVGFATSPVSRQSYNLSEYDTIQLVAFGKASAAMATAVLDRLVEPAAAPPIGGGAVGTTREQPWLKEPNSATPPSIPADSRRATATTAPREGLQIQGVVICKDGHVTEQQRDYLQRYNIAVHEASHPVPDSRGVIASEALLNLVQQQQQPIVANAQDNNDAKKKMKKRLVIACISGGGSALFCTPLTGLTLAELQATNTALLQTGWNIQTVNTVRKVLERGKGGGLAMAAMMMPNDSDDLCGNSETNVLSLILSDVLGDPLDLIASGPTVIPHDSKKSVQEAWRLVSQTLPPHIQFPDNVMKTIETLYEKSLLPQQSGAFLSENMTQLKDRCFNLLVGNNAIAVETAAKRAKELGYHPIVLGTQLQGEASTVAQILVGLAQHIRQGSTKSGLHSSQQFPVALIAGGETTVTLPSSTSTTSIGKGGRNQELALAAALALQQHQLRQVVLASVGTDGSDGPTDAAGAIVDGGTVSRIHNAMTVRGDSGESADQALLRHNAYPFLDRKDERGHAPLVKVCFGFLPWNDIAQLPPFSRFCCSCRRGQQERMLPTSWSS